MTLSTLFDLSGRVALVSGAGRGMGRAMAMALAEAGSDVMLMGSLAEAVTATTSRNWAAAPFLVACDVSQPEQIRTVFARLDKEFGRIDFLGNVAGEAVLGAPADIPLEAVEQTWRNIVFGRFCACQEAGRRMLAAGRGSIVNIGTIASVTAMGRGHKLLSWRWEP